jgi:cell division protein FtsQ
MARSLAAPAPRRLLRRPANPAAGLPRPLRAATRIARGGAAFAWERRRLRIALVATLVAIPLLAGGWWLARHTSLTAVEHVQVNGLAAVHGADTGAIAAALTGAARGMSTLDVKPAALRAAVAPYPIVRSVRARAKFPHGMSIEVVEQPPVAALVIDGARTAVAADGVVLGPGFLSGALPLVSMGKTATAGATATTTLPVAGGSVRGTSLLGALTVLGAAPTPLARTVTRVYSGPKGLTVVLHSGLLVYFGDGTRPHAKWLSLARVLADPSSAGAAYIDVRLPERPAAGFAPGTAAPDASSGEAASSSSSDPATANELAAGLDAAVGGGSSSVGGGSSSVGGGSSSVGGGSSSVGEATSTGSSPSEAGSAGSASGEATNASPSEAGSAGSPETPAASAVPGG